VKPHGAAIVLALALLGAGASADEPYRSAPDAPIAIDHIALDLDVDIPARTVTGTATLDVKAVSDLASIRLDAVQLDVSSVKATRTGGQTGAATFTNDGTILEVKTPLKRGEGERLEIAYSVHDPRAGLHFHAPTPQEPDVPLQVYSQGEAQTNRYWVPCIDSPCVRQTTEVTAHVPAGFEALSNGKLLEKADEQGGKKTRFHWSQDKNHVAYLISLIVGKFHVGKDEWHGKPVLFYVPEKHKEEVERVFGHTKAMLEFFSEKIGVEYAWDKYSQCTVEQFGWGGMENVSATTLNERTLHDARAHLDYDSDGLISHELAHQWWGDLLTCHDWAHIWLNEGFASYFEALWDEKQNGQDEFEYNMYEKSRGATDDGCKRRPVVDHGYNDPESVFDSRAYPKGAWVLHGLRRRLGDEIFWRAIHRYCVEHKFQTVETVDLRRAFEAESGQSLERYFHDLTERPGHPTLDVSYDYRDGLLEVTVKQTQPTDPFAVRTVIRADGTEIPFSMSDEREKRILYPLAARPKIVRLDPREGTLKELTEHKGDDEWRAQLAEDPQPIGRIRAAWALADSHQPANVAAVAKALATDKLWFVASECAKALGRAGGDAARDALVAGLAHASPKVRRSVLEALQGFRNDAKVVAAVKPFLEKGDPSYYVEAEALGTYASIRADDARAWLEKGLAKPSHNDVIREHAVSALASLEDPSVLPILEKIATEPGKYEHGVRAHAVHAWARVAALPGVAPEARQKVVERLAQMVDKEGIRLRWSAIDALGGLGKEATTALAAVDAAVQRDGEGRIRDAAKRAADRIRAGTPPNVEVARLRDEIQRLKEDEEKLVKRLERVEAKGAAPAPGPSTAPAPAPTHPGGDRQPD
jgi:aminopeptidase N